METYALNAYGLLITPELAAVIIHEQEKRDGSVPAEIQAMLDAGGSIYDLALDQNDVLNELGYLDPSLAAEMLDDDGRTVESHGEFTGTARTPAGLPDGVPNRSWYYDDEPLSFIPVKEQPSLFAAAYPCIDAVADELADAIGDALPDGIDVRPFIVHIDGIYVA